MFPKLLLTVLLVAIVWFGFQYLQRLAEFKHHRDRLRRGTAPPPPKRPAESGVQDLVKCPVCDTWQAGNARRRCDRANCPY
jgi:hypothetical protein